ncbi:hypothetical protein [Synechococcus sp. MU1643]|nr:hypothetical protein [Synechococcus sp. MU1643]
MREGEALNTPSFEGWRVVLVSWHQPTWLLVLFCAGMGGLTMA